MIDTQVRSKVLLGARNRILSTVHEIRPRDFAHHNRCTPAAGAVNRPGEIPADDRLSHAAP
jgi:hypothetical protein